MITWQGWILTAIAQVTAISLAALILTVCWRRNVSGRHTIGVVGLLFILGGPLIALLLPQPTWWRGSFSATAAQPLAEMSRPMSSDDELPTRMVAAVRVHETTANSGSVHPPPAPDTAAVSDVISQSASRDMPVDRPYWKWAAILACFVWLAGSVASAAAWLRQRKQLARLARSLNLLPRGALPGDASSVHDPNVEIATVARDVSAAVGLRELPSIAVSPLVPMPLVIGVWKPIIVIPSDLLRAGAEAELREVLIHEAAHVVRRDAWINVAQRLATVLWWWHPGVLRLNRVIARSREEVCDNFVLNSSDASHYAQTLLDIAEKCTKPCRVAASLGLLDIQWTLETRIAGLLKPGRKLMTRTGRRAVAIFAVLLGAVCISIGGVRAVEGDKGNTRKPETKETEVAAASPEKAVPAVELRKVAVRGRCVDDESHPLAGARIVVVRCSEDYRSHTVAGETKCDANGRFELRGIETAMPDHGDLFFAASLKEYVSGCGRLANPVDDLIEKEITLSSNPGTLSGVVRDAEGRPIAGVTVYLPCFPDEPLPGIRSSVTDAHGRYAIPDLKRWTPESTKTFDKKSGTGTMTTASIFRLKHPDYPKSTAKNSAVPQEVNVTLYPPAIVEGQVVDGVTNRPAGNVVVSAQGVGRDGWYQTTSDAMGRYRLLMTRDHYNIWAEADDRIAVAVKAIKAQRGETARDADIRLVRCGFVVGTVFGIDGQPISPTKQSPTRVAHYGPARPQTGAAVASTLVQPDGTYRLRVAPGLNYVYSMTGTGSSAEVDVQEGEEVQFDIRLGEGRVSRTASVDQRLAAKLRQAAEEEDNDEAAQGTPKSGAGSKRSAPKPASRQRAATPAGKLLDQLAELNASNDRFRDEWARTLKSIADLGQAATPDLIAELDATNDNMMLRSVGFILRAINDKRAVPALIRAVPKTLLPPGSDMGLATEDNELLAFMQKHDLSDHDEAMRYSFGRPVREIFGALRKLTGQSFDEEQLFHIFSDGTLHQQRMKQELFDRTATRCTDWWEKHWSEYLRDAAYSRVNLPRRGASATTASGATQGRHFKTGGGDSNWVLESYTNPKAGAVLYDFDTGRAAALPEKWRQSKHLESDLDEIERWAAEEGFDMLGMEWKSPDNGQRYFALRPIGLQAWELGTQRWKMTFSDMTFENIQAEGTAATGMLLHFDREKKQFDPKATATFLFKTREGTPGLLFVGIEVQDDSLKPGGVSHGDNELEPVAFRKGRRFAWTSFEELPAKAQK